MPLSSASLYSERGQRQVTERLGLSQYDLPLGGNFHPEDNVLAVLLDQLEGRNPCTVVCLGAGLAAVVAARALALSSAGTVTAMDTDGRMLSVAQQMLDDIGASARLIHAELQDYDKHNMWYARWSASQLPQRIDVLFVDGPGHWAGRSPRWPAGPELFHKIVPGGVVVLDDGRRVKEKKALELWAERHPDFKKLNVKKSGGAVVLRKND